MGRKLMRVPMDFNWPKDSIWEGYINPYGRKVCRYCQGSGVTPASKELEKWAQKIVWSPLVTGGDSEYIRLTTGLAGREPGPARMGHDSLDAGHAYRMIVKAAGLPEDWGKCQVCDGEGIDPEYVDRFNDWAPVDPPEGPGFQLWETTTEGSPQSPVFNTLDALCEWCESNANTFARETATKEQWKKMLSDDFVYHQEGNSVWF